MNWRAVRRDYNLPSMEHSVEEPAHQTAQLKVTHHPEAYPPSAQEEVFSESEGECTSEAQLQETLQRDTKRGHTYPHIYMIKQGYDMLLNQEASSWTQDT